MAYKPLDQATKRHILGEAGPVFLRAIGRHVAQPIFLAHLVKHNVISPEESRDISDIQITGVKAEKLLNHLHQCSIKQFIDFCIILHDEADRADILTDMFGIAVDHLREQREQSPPPCPSSISPSQRTTEQSPHPSGTVPEGSSTMEPEVVRIIADHAKGCLRLLMHHNLYDIGDSPTGKVIHTGKLYIKLDTQQESIDGNITQLAEEDILKCAPGESSLRVVQVHGPPGAGKTALAEHVVCDWAKKFLENIEKFGLAGVAEDLFKVMVFIPSRTIKNSLDEAIWDHLLCKDQDKKILLKFIKQGNGIGLALDAIDEIRNKTVLHNVREYLKFQHTSGDGTCVLVTTRSDLGQVESAIFDRLLILQGFTWDQGIDYIKAYFPGDKSEKVVAYTQAHQQQLFPIITNPLRAHIYCALISEGELKLDENEKLSILKLFHLLEKCLIKRKGSKVTEEQSRNLYCMCMHGLLHGVRQFSQELFDQFNINKSCHIFFLRKEKTSPVGSEVSYSFPHEMMYEYFAGRYIETLSLESRKALLLSISVATKLRNLQKIISQVLIEQDQLQLLQMMARAIVILQHECNEENKPKGLFQRFTFYGKLVKLHKQIQPLEKIDLTSLDVQSTRRAKEINKVWHTIDSVFEDPSAPLQKNKWYRGLGNGVFQHVTDCLQACSPDQMAMLSKRTTDHLLPCSNQHKNGDNFVCVTGECRWSEITFNRKKGYVGVNAWIAEDAMGALHQARLSDLPSVKFKKFGSLSMNIDKYRNMWGEPPDSSLQTQEAKFSGELQHWCSICERFQFSSSGDASHSVQMVFHPITKSIDVKAKSIHGVKKVLYQVRFSAAEFCRRHTFTSMTISVDEQPSDESYSPVEDAALKGESNKWWQLCKCQCVEYSIGKSSYQIVYGASSSRLVEFIYGNNKIEVGAWDLEDAKEALCQVRKSGTRSQIQHTYSHIALTMKNWSLWGQPPSSAFSPQACDSLNAEIRNWSDICESRQMIYPIGTDRCAEVVYGKDKIQVGAWCLGDIKEALYQARTSANHTQQHNKYDGITLTMKNWSLWGQPPSSTFLPQEYDSLNAELQNWSNICERSHYVCSTSATRYGEVVYEPGTYNNSITVHAWCVDDVQQLLYQYRTSAAASTHHVEDVRWLDLYINKYQSLWGQPPPDTASTPDVWTGVYTELQKWAHMCTEDYKYIIYLCTTTPLHPLLVSGMRTRVLGVWYGTIDIQDLYTLVHTGQLTHVWGLSNTHIVMPPNGDQAVLREMREEVVQAMAAGIFGDKLLDDPLFITQTGEEYT